MATRYFCDRCGNEILEPLATNCRQIPKSEKVSVNDRTKAMWIFCAFGEDCIVRWDEMSRDLEQRRRQLDNDYQEYVRNRVREFNAGGAGNGITA